MLDRENNIGIYDIKKEDLITKIDSKLKEVNSNYEVPESINIDENIKNEQHNVQELIDKIDEKLKNLMKNLQ